MQKGCHNHTTRVLLYRRGGKWWCRCRLSSRYKQLNPTNVSGDGDSSEIHHRLYLYKVKWILCELTGALMYVPTIVTLRSLLFPVLLNRLWWLQKLIRHVHFLCKVSTGSPGLLKHFDALCLWEMHALCNSPKSPLLATLSHLAACAGTHVTALVLGS